MPAIIPSYTSAAEPVAVIIGEGEITIADLADRFSPSASIEDVPGIAYLDDACAVKRTSPRPFIKSLDEMPFPAWDLVDIDRYRQTWHGHHGYHSMNIATTRGCPYHCNWCAKPILRPALCDAQPESRGRRDRMAETSLRARSPLDRGRRVWIEAGWVEEFAALVNERNARIPFRCLMRADQVTESVATALASAGCRMLWMGAESGSQKGPRRDGKGLRVDDIRTANRLLKAAGHRRRRLPAVRVSRRDVDRHRSDAATGA
jgi:anaerobic magnesium-protoporphyrin IX monomethyl ester cyclase